MNIWSLENRIRLFKAFFVSLVIPCTLAFTALGIYFANVLELPGNPGSVCTAVLIQAAVGILLLFAVQLPFLGSKMFTWIATTLFTAGFLFWFQANVFNWDFGVLDGRDIPWKSYIPLGIFELFVYGAILFAAFRFRNKLLEHIIPASCILLLMQAIPVSLAVVQTLIQETEFQAEQTEDQPEHSILVPTWKQYSITFDGFFDFSPEENVVLIVLDELGKRIFDDIQKEHPGEIEDIFHDFTCFTNVACDRPLTRYCIPQIFTGGSEDFVSAVIQHKIFNRDGALLKTLSENQYRCKVFSWVPHVIYFDSRWIANIHLNDQQGYIAETSELAVLTLFRSVPTLLKQKVIRSSTLRTLFHFVHESHSSYQQIAARTVPDDEVNAWIKSAPRNVFADQKMFKFMHLQGAHRPYILDENFERVARLGTKSSGHQQALGSLRMIKNLLELMKEAGVYDQSLIVIMSDHGPAPVRSDYDPVQLREDPSISLRPSFFMKRKYAQQSQMDYNDNPIHISDTSSIILSELGILQDENAFSPFEMPESLVNERKSRWEKIWSSRSKPE